jgi:hypothetical protein
MFFGIMARSGYYREFSGALPKANIIKISSHDIAGAGH